MINKIMVNKQKGNFLVLKNLDVIYSLLTNSEVKYIKILICFNNILRAEINYKFKIVVLIDKEYCYYKALLFLNKFEKHYLINSNN